MSRWVFLRGLMRESRHWGCFPEQFMRHVEDAQLTLPDLAGNGKLHDVRSPHCVDGMVEHYRLLLAGQAVKPPYFLLALSLGGMVAVAWAHRYPGELAGCVLMNTSMRPFSPFYRRLQWRNYPGLLGMALSGGDVRARERLILTLTSNSVAADATTLNAWASYREDCPVSRGNTLRQLVAAAMFKAPDTKPPVPMLVLCSAGDKLVDPCCSQQLARAWQTAFALHPDAGHDLSLDDGDWVAARICDWLDGRRKGLS